MVLTLSSGCSGGEETTVTSFGTLPATATDPTVAMTASACGTHATGWLNGAQPTVQEGAVDRQICFNWSGNQCNWSEPAKVRNCGDFFVYYLKNVSWGCHGRYCGTN